MEWLKENKNAILGGVVVAGLGFLTYRYVRANRRYPNARRCDQVDLYHGKKVADPYRW